MARVPGLARIARRAPAGLGALLLGLALAAPAPAALLRYELTGVVTSVEEPLGSLFSMGDPVTVVVVIDDETVPEMPQPDVAQYLLPEVSADFGSASGQANPLSSSMIVNDSPGQDELRIGGATLSGFPAPVGYVASNITALLHDGSGTAFSSLALPTSLALEDFDSATARLHYQETGTSNTSVVLADVTAVDVPEPAGALGQAAALAVLALGARRRRGYCARRREPRRGLARVLDAGAPERSRGRASATRRTARPSSR